MDVRDFENYRAAEKLENDLYLKHYGTPRHSGRYPWGSGENPYQHESDGWLERVNELKKRGLHEHQVAEAMGCTATELRAWEANAKAQRKSLLISECKELYKKGYSYSEIARMKGINSSNTVKNYVTSDKDIKPLQARATADFLEKQVDEKGFIDIGLGVEKELLDVDGNLGITRNKMQEAVALMKSDGYTVFTSVGMPQVTNTKQQTYRWVACKFPPGMSTKEMQREVYLARDEGKIQSVAEYHSDDAGLTWNAPKPPVSIDSKRITINYAEDGGIDKDGVIEIRRGVPDLSLGNSHYAQVRIAVDGTHYLKGMAVYADDLPDGVDIRFNTNKHSDIKMIDGSNGVLKPMKKDPNDKSKIDESNPFGAVIMRGGQSEYTDPSTGEKKQSAINKIHDEGDWQRYSKDLPAQFLSKQNTNLIKKQLDYSIQDIKNEYQDILNINNPTIRKYYLEKFADGCDGRAVSLKASSLPRQQYQVIMPVPSLKNDEVYAPNYRDGEQVALIRFPHQGTFEIPILTVNNKNKEAIKMFGKTPTDVVGINKENADRLSGADFDGDDVIVIPTGRGNKVKINNSDPIPALKGYDPKEVYGTHVDYDENGKEIYINRNGVAITPLTESRKQREMGVTTNLLTDMTVAGAPIDDIAKATKHAQTIIDASKHHLDWKQSEIDNDIASLKKMYQIKYNEDGSIHVGGSSTLLSRASGEARVPETGGQKHYNMIGKPWYDPSLPEGAVILKPTGRTKKAAKITTDDEGNESKEYYDTGEIATKKTTQMAVARDARDLISAIRSEPEILYADYANQLKALANDARKTYMYTKDIQYNPSAKKEYAAEVESLEDKLDKAYRAKPKEARAQNIALGIINQKVAADPNLSAKDLKKIRQIAIEQARAQVGADRKDREIQITDREWAAIQSGAITPNKLSAILKNTNPDSLRERATPRTGNSLSEAQIARIKNMHNGFYTIAQIADIIGCSTSTISRVLKEA